MTRDLAEKKKKKRLTRDLAVLDRKIMTATETGLQRVTPRMQNCVDVLQPTEHMGEWNNLLSALLPLPSQRPHGIFQEEHAERQLSAAAAATRGNLAVEQTAIYASHHTSLPPSGLSAWIMKTAAACGLYLSNYWKPKILIWLELKGGKRL